MRSIIKNCHITVQYRWLKLIYLYLFTELFHEIFISQITLQEDKWHATI